MTLENNARAKFLLNNKECRAKLTWVELLHVYLGLLFVKYHCARVHALFIFVRNDILLIVNGDS